MDSSNQQRVDEGLVVEEIARGLRSGDKTNIVVNARVCINFKRDMVIVCPLPDLQHATDEPIRPYHEVADCDVADPQTHSAAPAEMDAADLAIAWRNQKNIHVQIMTYNDLLESCVDNICQHCVLDVSERVQSCLLDSLMFPLSDETRQQFADKFHAVWDMEHMMHFWLHNTSYNRQYNSRCSAINCRKVST
jgi:hypothetical protein